METNLGKPYTVKNYHTKNDLFVEHWRYKQFYMQYNLHFPCCYELQFAYYTLISIHHQTSYRIMLFDYGLGKGVDASVLVAMITGVKVGVGAATCNWRAK